MGWSLVTTTGELLPDGSTESRCHTTPPGLPRASITLPIDRDQCSPKLEVRRAPFSFFFYPDVWRPLSNCFHTSLKCCFEVIHSILSIVWPAVAVFFRCHANKLLLLLLLLLLLFHAVTESDWSALLRELFLHAGEFPSAVVKCQKAISTPTDSVLWDKPCHCHNDRLALC